MEEGHFDFISENEKRIKDLEELLEKAKTADGYMVTITTVNGQKLEHSLVINTFERVNMLPSLKEVKELVIEELEKNE